jgi:phosphomannomutase
MITDARPIQFGTDGWRGIIADDFTMDRVRRAAAASARYMQHNHPNGDGSVIVGYDRRFLSRQFAEATANVFASYQIPVRISSTPLPTPAVSFSVVHQKASWGIMITASHNPAPYNGFKIKESHGRSAPPEVTREIEAYLNAPASEDSTASVPLVRFDDQKAYAKYLKDQLDWKLLRGFPKTVVFDYLYGVGAIIPETILHGSKIKIHSLHAAVDPLFGNLHPEPIESSLLELCQTVRKQKAVVGIALDGDADRLGVVSDQGVYMTPHQVFPLLVLHCIEHKGWRGKIVQAVSLGYLSERIAREFNLPFEEVPVGFKHVAERMLQPDFLAGGEESGGYAMRGGLPERDGILNGLLFIEMLAARKQTPSQLLHAVEKRFGRACFKRVDIHLKEPIWDRTRFTQETSSRIPEQLIHEPVSEVRTRDGLKIILKSGSWVLMRPSGTEPLIRTYAETDNPQKTEQLLRWAEKAVSAA